MIRLFALGAIDDTDEMRCYRRDYTGFIVLHCCGGGGGGFDVATTTAASWPAKLFSRGADVSV